MGAVLLLAQSYFLFNILGLDMLARLSRSVGPQDSTGYVAVSVVKPNPSGVTDAQGQVFAHIPVSEHLTGELITLPHDVDKTILGKPAWDLYDSTYDLLQSGEADKFNTTVGPLHVAGTYFVSVLIKYTSDDPDELKTFQLNVSDAPPEPPPVDPFYQAILDAANSPTDSADQFTASTAETLWTNLFSSESDNVFRTTYYLPQTEYLAAKREQRASNAQHIQYAVYVEWIKTEWDGERSSLRSLTEF